VVCNGVALPESAPTVMRALGTAGYRTALVGKAHFDPLLDLTQRYAQNRLAPRGSTGPWFGFDHVELAVHAPIPTTHYGSAGCSAASAAATRARPR
jgi:arylsulfatase A-like enzyme